MKKVIVLYLLGTFAAAFVAVLINYIFPITITLTGKAAEGSSPNGIGEVISNLLLKIVDNPVNALQQANYIGILSWATVFGIAMREASEHSKDLLQTLADITSKLRDYQPAHFPDLKQGSRSLPTESMPLVTMDFAVTGGNDVFQSLVINQRS